MLEADLSHSAAEIPQDDSTRLKCYEQLVWVCWILHEMHNCAGFRLAGSVKKANTIPVRSSSILQSRFNVMSELRSSSRAMPNVVILDFREIRGLSKLGDSSPVWELEGEAPRGGLEVILPSLAGLLQTSERNGEARRSPRHEQERLRAAVFNHVTL